MKNASAGGWTSPWGAVVVLAGIILVGFSHGGCDNGSSGSSAGGGQGAYLVDLILSGDPISLQVSTSTTVTATGQYSDSSSKIEPVTWSLSPTGFATIDANGLLTAGGTPGLTYVWATAVADPSIRQSALVNVTSLPPPPPTITTTTATLAQGYTGSNYSFTLQRINGQNPFSWSLKTGSLPTGLTLNSSTGVISGMPAVQGSSLFTVMVTDAVGGSDDEALTLTVNPGGSGSGSGSSTPTPVEAF